MPSHSPVISTPAQTSVQILLNAANTIKKLKLNQLAPTILYAFGTLIKIYASLLNAKTTLQILAKVNYSSTTIKRPLLRFNQKLMYD